MKRHPLLILSLLAASLLGGFSFAQAAPDVAFTISAASQGPGKAVPTLAWSATPTPASCAAPWTTSTAASGTKVLGPVTANAAYAITCTWAADTQASLSWTAPTVNTDGTPLTDLASYNVYWHAGDPSLVTAPDAKVRNVPAGTLTTNLTGLTPGLWNAAVTAINAAGVESAISNIAPKTIGGPTVITKNAALVFPGTVVVTVK